MTIEEFMTSFNISKRSTIERWLEEDLIPGSRRNKQGEWDLSKFARPPYTKARARKASSIYISIVDGCNQRKCVFAKLYKIPQEEFQIYIDQLIRASLISVKRDRGVEFYFATPTSIDYKNDRKGLKRIIKTFDPLIAAASYGVTKAVLDKADNK